MPDIQELKTKTALQIEDACLKKNEGGGCVREKPSTKMKVISRITNQPPKTQYKEILEFLNFQKINLHDSKEIIGLKGKR